MRTLAAAALLTATLAAAPPALAAATIPVRVRIIKGSRQGPPAYDPRLEDLRPQLGRLSYVRWDETGQQHFDLEFNKPVEVALPDGNPLRLTLMDSRKDTVTFQVHVPAHKTNSKLTISKDQRIVHQVTDEKGGEAYFVTIRPWP